MIQQTAQQMYQEVQSLKMNMDPVLAKRILKYTIKKIKEELVDVERMGKINLSEPHRFWTEIEKEIENGSYT